MNDFFFDLSNNCVRKANLLTYGKKQIQPLSLGHTKTLGLDFQDSIYEWILMADISLIMLEYHSIFTKLDIKVIPNQPNEVYKIITYFFE